MNSNEVFIHIHQGCFAGTGAIVRLPQCQWSKPDGYGKISQCITTTKHSKAKTVCIFLGIYCTCNQVLLLTDTDSNEHALFCKTIYWYNWCFQHLTEHEVWVSTCRWYIQAKQHWSNFLIRINSPPQHYNDVTWTSKGFRSSITRLFVQAFVFTTKQNENSEFTCYLWGETTNHRWSLLTNGK